MIEKGFSKPTARVDRLRNQILDATPYVEAERVELVTEAYRESENLSSILRRAKVNEKLFNEFPVIIRDDELVVGSKTIHPRSTDIGVEFSFDWVEKEYETMGTRMADPFQIPKETAERLHEAFKYWKGKTNSEYAESLMSPETLDCINNGVFTVGNYFYGGIGHVCVDYGKILKVGFRGILADTVAAMQSLDTSDPSYIQKEQFYNAVIITYNAAINFAHRYADKAAELASTCTDPQRKQELLTIASNCTRVPEYGATNFWEACQSFWFIQLMMQMESNGHSISPGRFDQYMYPYYEADNTISKDFAQELVDCIWVKLNDINKTRDEVSAQAFAGYAVFQNLGVGGQNEEGLDATNEMSYMAMEASAHVRLPQPSFSIRVWQDTPDEFLYRACELARLGMGVPAMYNDEVIIPALVNRGVSLRDARNYCIIGCVEPQVPHKTDGWHDAAFFNVAKVLDITLHGGKVGDKQLGPVTPDMTTWKNLDDLYAAFREQMKYFVFHLAEADNCVDYAHMRNCPLPFESAMVDDCIGRGKSCQEGGAIYNFTGPQAFGVADTGDSVYAIEKNVFEDGKITLEQLKDALDHNFGHDINEGLSPAISGKAREEALAQGNTAASTSSLTEADVAAAVAKVLAQLGSGASTDSIKSAVVSSLSGSTTAPSGDYEALRRLLDHTDSFGNDIDAVDFVARKCAQIYCQEVEKYKNPRGGQFQAGVYPVSANVLFGKDVNALPDGRLAKAPLADGVSPRQGKDVNGPTAATNSVAKLDHCIASNGTLYNMKFNPPAVAGDQGLKNFAAVVRSYFDHKGMHVQFNVISRETLIEAQKHPEQHRDLVVRVAGYSAQFVTLAKEVQDDIISRTEQNM